MSDEKRFNSLMGRRLKALRKLNKVSQSELGELLGIHQTAVCRVEKGTQDLTPWQLYRLAKHFKLSVAVFLEGE